MGNFVECFWKIKDCGVNCFVRLDSICYVMNGIYELCFCWLFCFKVMLIISEYFILWKMFYNMVVYNVFKYFWCNVGKWYGFIIWRIWFFFFFVDSVYVGVFLLDRYSFGINIILIYISKNFWYFMGIFF